MQYEFNIDTRGEERAKYFNQKINKFLPLPFSVPFSLHLLMNQHHICIVLNGFAHFQRLCVFFPFSSVSHLVDALITATELRSLGCNSSPGWIYKKDNDRSLADTPSPPVRSCTLWIYCTRAMSIANSHACDGPVSRIPVEMGIERNFVLFPSIIWAKIIIYTGSYESRMQGILRKQSAGNL